MSMPPDPDRRLSEISHLFLSSVRDRQTLGRPAPRRTPPGAAGGAEAGSPAPAQPSIEPTTPDAPRPARNGRPGDGSDIWSPPADADLADAVAGLTRVPEPPAAPATPDRTAAVRPGAVARRAGDRDDAATHARRAADPASGSGDHHGPTCPHPGHGDDGAGDDFDPADDEAAAADARAIDGDRCKPLSAVVGPHLLGGLLDAARQYAGHRASTGRRVGMIHLDADAPGRASDAAVRLMSFEADGDGRPLGDYGDDLADPSGDGPRGDADALAEALVEMDCDVDEWLLVVADPDAPRARAALAAATRWVVPTTADHDGVVGAYRSIKSLLAPPAPAAGRDGSAYDDAFLTPPALGGVGLMDRATGGPARAPAVSLAVLDAVTAAHADRAHAKVAGACRQFLGFDLLAADPAAFNADVAELPVLTCGGGAGTDRWDVLADFIDSGRDADAEARAADEAAAHRDEDVEAGRSTSTLDVARVSRERSERFADDEKRSLRSRLTGTVYREVTCDGATIAHPVAAGRIAADQTTADVADADGVEAASVAPATPSATATADPRPAAPRANPSQPVRHARLGATMPNSMHPDDLTNTAAPAVPADTLRLPAGDADTVLDLPAGASASCVVSAVLNAPGSDLAACPVAPPMQPSGTVAVGRDGRLVLMAAVDGPASLPPTMAAFRWLAENRKLLAMALPQFRVDASLEPQLRLHVDHARRAELSAESLRPLLRGEAVSVRTYRTLKWGGRTGLLLEAA